MRPIYYVYIIIAFFLSISKVFSQEQGIIYYKAEYFNSISKDAIKNGEEKSNPAFFKQIMEIDQNISFILKDTDFILKFKNGTTNFEIKPTVEHDKNKFYSAVVNLTGTDGVIFQDVYKKEYLKQKKAFGKKYLIEVKPVIWKTYTIEKKIGVYTCYKATAVFEEKGMDDKNMKFDITAWFTPEIPLASGPKGYGGLPGLILELNFNDVYRFYVSKMNLFPKNEIIIDKPTKGVCISEEEFMELERKTMQNMKRN